MRNLDVFNSKQPSKALAYNAHLHIQDISKKSVNVSWNDATEDKVFDGKIFEKEVMFGSNNNGEIYYKKLDTRNNSIDGKDNMVLDGTKYKANAIRNVRSLPVIYCCP